MEEPEYTSGKRSRRITKACIRCHERKVKCNGEEPCARCSKESRECVYDRVSKPRKPRRRKEEMRATSSSGSETTKSPMKVEKNAQLERNGLFSRLNNLIEAAATGKQDGTALKSAVLESQVTADVNFSQPTFTAFSPRGIRWIIASLKAEEGEDTMKAVYALQAAIHQFQRACIQSMKLWVDPAFSMTPLPDRKLTEQISSVYFRRSIPFSDTLSEESVQKYYERFYGNTGSEKPLGYSEMMVLNTLLVHGTTLLLQDSVYEPEKAILSKEELLDMREKYLKNSIYLYNRVSVVGDGLTCVQALILLIQHFGISAQTNCVYMIISTAVRFAQELGLHRREANYGLPDEIIRERLLIWWACYYFDKMYCMVSGKPPVINDLDVSVIYPMDLIRISLFFKKAELSPDGVLEMCFALVKNVSNWAVLEEIVQLDLSDYSEEEIRAAILNVRSYSPDSSSLLVSFHLTDLASLVSKYYNTLLSPSVTSNPRSAHKINFKIDELNKDLESWTKRLPPKLRPGEEIVFESGDNSSNKVPIHTSILSLHFNYYMVVLVVNRLSTVNTMFGNETLKNAESDELANKSLDLSISCATRILELTQLIHQKKVRQLTADMCGLSAIITLFCYCLKRPQVETFGFYVELLASSVRHMFKSMQAFAHSEEERFKNEWLHEMFSLLAFLLADYYKRHHGQKKLEDRDFYNCIGTLRSIIESAPKVNSWKPRIKPNMMNGFYTLNLASNISAPEFTDAKMAPPITSIESILSAPTDVAAQTAVPTTDLPAAPLSSVQPQLAPVPMTKDFLAADVIPTYSTVANPDQGGDVNKTFAHELNESAAFGNMDYQDSGYLYQSMFNLPNMLIGDNTEFTDFPDVTFGSF